MLRVRLLGELTIELDGNTLEPPTSKRARALLGWLVLERRMHGRSSLAARFWPDVLDESARTSLRSALSALRKSLGPDSEQYLIAGRDEVGLANQELVWTDVAEFDRCVAEGRLEEALELSRGELLAGLDDDWVFERRDEHRDRVMEVLARLAARAEGNQDLQSAIAFTRREVALDPLAEEPHRQLMRRLAAAGDRAAAIRAYDRLSQRLREELRITPSHATRELAETLRTESGGAQPPAAAVAVAPQPAVDGAQGPADAIVTLLFTDLVGSTELLSALGDDQAEQFRRLHFGLLRDVAMAHSGQEVKNLGDGLMVAFPSAVNAIHCAVGIQQAVHRHNARSADNRFQVRVGLNIGEPIRAEEDYFGTPVVVAKRLCDKAGGGQILASELLRALVGTRGSFEFRSCGAMELKGISEALPTCEVVWEPAEERRIALPSPLMFEGAAPLVGRAAQLDQLHRRWGEVRDGRRGVALLVGEPGIGKTRLAAEFCRGAYGDGACVLLGRCYEESLVPYQPFVEALRQYVAESSPEQLRLTVGPHRTTLARLIPELAGPEGEAVASPSGAPPEPEQFVMFDAVASLLRAVAEERPLVVVLDDLHWADSPTLLLLRHVVRASDGASLLILGTYRGTEVDEAHPLAPALAELRRARVLESITVTGLGEEDLATLISAHAGASAPAAVARSILDRTEGNPFFVEEVLRELGSDADWDDALASVGVPDSVKDLLLRRMRRLDDTCKRLLPLAAVTGREFGLGILERISEMSADQVAESLEQAIAARIIDEVAGSVGRYSFAHALIRETIYDALSFTRRAQLHRLIGEAIESEASDRLDEQASALAYHFSAAGNVAKAYEYHARAADAAERVYAIEPALAQCTAALDAGAKLGLQPEREPGLRRLLLQRGRMRARTGDANASVDYKAALDGARRSGDRALEMETLNELGIIQLASDLGSAAATHEEALLIAEELGDTAAQTNALDRLAVISSHQLAFDRGLELGERALELARDTGDLSLVGRAIDSIKLAVWQLGDLKRLEELTGELEPIWRERGELWYLQFTLLEAAFVPIGAGRWEDAGTRLADAAAVNRRAGDPLCEALIADGFCWFHRSRGAYEDALAAGRRAMELSPEVAWEGWAAATLGWTLLDLCSPAEAAEILERGLAAAERIGRPNETVRCLSQLAWAHSLLGDSNAASKLAARAGELLEQVSVPPGGAFLFGAHAYVALARVYLAAGEPERGEALLRPMLGPARQSGWRDAEATTELASGLCLEARGELELARAAFARVVEVADQCGIPAPSWEAHSALGRLADSSAEADGHAASAAAIVERMSEGLKDDAMRRRLRELAIP